MKQNRLYVGNLPYSTTESDLEATFSAYGQVEDASIIMDRDTGRSRGFGFVTFGSNEDAEAALALDGHDLGGRRLVVNVARERASGPRRSGGD